MYHYVRDLRRSRYPRIKGLATERFVGQLDYIRRHYTVCGTASLLTAMRRGDPLPSNPCILTFDDGLIDHYVTVFPLLKERELVGCFYPVGLTVSEDKVLDVHKLHHVLAAAEDPGLVAVALRELLASHRAECDLPSDDALWSAYAKPGRVDGPEVVFIKAVLQRGLPVTVRSRILDELFRRFVTEDEAAFARELYMDVAQLRSLLAEGMEIGGHGYSHCWLEHLSKTEQREEIRRTQDFLSGIFQQPPVDWTMCYPYGSYNQDTVALLREGHCELALTVNVGLVADLTRPYELMRLDTNQLPFTADAEPCTWTVEASRGALATGARLPAAMSVGKSPC